MKLLLALLLTASAAAQPFRVEPIRAHMRFLADDALEGRGTATRGHRIAAHYVAAQFEAAGLEPGANGNWFQEVPLLATAPDPSSTVTLMRGGQEDVTLRAFESFVTNGDPLKGESLIEAPVVFARFGVTATDQGYDDYAGIDARGKIVAVFAGAPPSFAGPLRAHHSNAVNKTENAVRHGAVAMMILQSPREALRAPWQRVVRQTRLGSMHWLRPDNTPHDVRPGLSTIVNLSLDATKLILGKNAEAVFASLERARPHADPLRQRDRIHIVSTHRTTSSPNVVGNQRGSDPKQSDEYLVYSAHLDHLGITEPVNGDAINNGAFDNTTGIASVIEIARAFAALPQRPRRSIVFLATTGEERGLKGADYFANNPTVPFESIVADINIDMLMLMHPTRDLVAHGIDNSDLGDVARQVAQEMKIELSPDRVPEENIFVRSDQYAFIKRGIPAIFVNSGYKGVDPSVDMLEIARTWRRTRYHSPQDDLSQPIDYTAALLPVEFDFRLGLAVANRDARPRWKPGDFFGKRFGR